MGLDFTRYKYIAIGVAIFFLPKFIRFCKVISCLLIFFSRIQFTFDFSNVISCLFHFFLLSSSRIWVTLFEYLAFLLMAI